MQENNSRSSFFDDDDLNIKFEFRKVEKKDAKDLGNPPICKDSLTRQIGTSAPASLFGLHRALMAYYKVSDFSQIGDSQTPTSKTPESVLDLSFSRLKPLPPTNSGGPYGFAVSKNGNNFEFYSQDKSVIDSWINALKGVCVLLTFHDDYKALKMIGRGSFAKVSF